MTKRKTRNGKRQSASPGRQPRRPGKPKPTFWHNRKVWLAGAVGTVVTGVVTGVMVNVSSNVLAAHNIAAPPAPTPSSLVKVPASPSAINYGSRVARSASNGPSLTVISEDPIYLDHAGIWVFPGKFAFTPSELKALNADPVGVNSSLLDLLFSLGAYQSHSDTQLVVQNNQAHEIRVLDMQVVKSCQASLTGTLIYSPDAGADPSVQLGFDLDSTDTEAQTGNMGIEPTVGKPDYFAGHTVSIQPGAQQVFDIITVTSKYSCSFRFLLTLLVGSKKENQLIGDGSQPFRITAIAGTARTGTEFSAYEAIYAGGVASPTGHSLFVPVDPKTYKGY